ncbi:MAG TPA: type II toxin-antitoxin system VapC family toxin [Thermoanaerobaculia bacterium]|nr:type II toxin-antitoxin system VapC family toxin [Thermoanaerobaculia bacterium]
MKGLLLDTNAYSAFKRGNPEAIEILTHAPLIGLDSIALGELLGGFAGGTKEAWNRQQLEEFFSSRRVQRILVDERTAEHYAKISVELKRKGVPIPTNDMWIAASALRHDLALFTYDGHFQYISDLLIGRTLEDFLL